VWGCGCACIMRLLMVTVRERLGSNSNHNTLRDSLTGREGGVAVTEAVR